MLSSSTGDDIFILENKSVAFQDDIAWTDKFYISEIPRFLSEQDTKRVSFKVFKKLQDFNHRKD